MTKRLEFARRDAVRGVADAMGDAGVTVAELCAYLALESAEDIAGRLEDSSSPVAYAVGHAKYLIRDLNPGMRTNDFWDMLSEEVHPEEALDGWLAEHERANAPDTSYVEMALR